MGPIEFPRHPKKDKKTTRGKTTKPKQYLPVEKIHHQRAKKLHQAIKQQGLLTAPFNENKWAHDFKKLETKVKKKTKQNVSVLEIDATLDWYAPKLGDRFLPLCSSAACFSIHFWRLLSFKCDDVGPAADVGAVAKDLVKQLTDPWDYPFWSDYSKQQLPAVVQLSLDTYSEFYQKASQAIIKFLAQCRRDEGQGFSILVNKKDKDGKLDRLARFVDNLGGRKLGCRADLGFPITVPESFVKRWFGDLYHSKIQWDKWDGKLNREIWSLNHPRFQQQMLDWSDTKGGKECWHRFLELVEEESK